MCLSLACSLAQAQRPETLRRLADGPEGQAAQTWDAASSLLGPAREFSRRSLWHRPRESHWARGTEPEAGLPSPEGPEEVVAGPDSVEQPEL